MIDQLPILTDSANHVMLWAQSMPGEGAQMEPIPGMEGPMNRIIGGAKYIGIFIAIIAAIAAAGGAAISRQRGTSEEATERFVTIAMAVAVIVTAVTIITWIADSAMAG